MGMNSVAVIVNGVIAFGLLCAIAALVVTP